MHTSRYLSKKISRDFFNSDNYPPSKRTSSFYILSTQICFACQCDIDSKEEFDRCKVCLKEFHKKCIELRFRDGFADKKCLFCQNYILSRCDACKKKIQSKDLTIKCEICSGKYHIQCQKTSIDKILQRRYYSSCFSDEKEKFFESLLNELSQYPKPLRETYYNILEEVSSKENFIGTHSILEDGNLFIICNTCLAIHKRIQEKSKEISSDNTDINNVILTPLYELHFAPRNVEMETNLRIKRVVCKMNFNDGTGRNYYMLKWKDIGYSIELGNFIEKHPYYSIQLDLCNSNSDERVIDIDSMVDQEEYQTGEFRLFQNSRYKHLVPQLKGNVFYFGKIPKIIGLEREIIIPYISKIINKIDILKYGALICVSNEDDLKFWKSQMKECNLNDIYFLNSKNTLIKIYYEVLRLKDTVRNAINPNKFDYLNKKEEDFQLHKKIVITTINIVEKYNIFNVVPFQVYLYKISTKEQFEKYSQLLRYKEAAYKYIISSYCPDYSKIICDLFSKFYSPDNEIVKYSPSFPLNLLNENLKFYSSNYDEMKKLIQAQFNWAFEYLDENSFFEVDMNNLIQSIESKRKFNFPIELNDKIKINKMIINFIPVDLGKDEKQQYNIVYSDKGIINNNKTINPEMTSKDLLTITSFPFLIDNHFKSIFKSSWVSTIPLLSPSKVNGIKQILKKLPQNQPKIILISSNNENIKNEFIALIQKAQAKNTNVFTFDNLSLMDEVIKANMPRHIIIYNFPIDSNDLLNFIRYVFNNQSATPVILYHLYSQNTVEENIIRLIYSKIDRVFPYGISSIYQIFTDDECYWALTNNYKLLNREVSQYCPKFNFTYQICTNPSNENTKEKDAVIFFENTDFLFVSSDRLFKRENSV